MTREDLSQLKYLDMEISRLLERIEALEDGVDAVPSSLRERLTQGGVSDIVASKAMFKEDLYFELNDCLNRRRREYLRLIREINRVEDSFLRQVLMYRYVDGMSWYEVADALGGNNTAATVRQACHRFFKKH